MADCEIIDIDSEDGVTFVTAPRTEYDKIRTALLEANPNLDLVEDHVAWVPMNPVELEDAKHIEQFQRLLALLEDDDDVQDVYHNVSNLPEGE